MVLDRVKYPEVSDKVRGAGVSHVAELSHHHLGWRTGKNNNNIIIVIYLSNPGSIDHSASSQLHQLPEVSPGHSVLGADVDWSNV